MMPPKILLCCCLWLLFCAPQVQAAARLVVLPVDALEVVRLLGGMPQVVGVAQHAAGRNALLPEAAGIPGVGKGFAPNLETIAALAPDVLVAWKGYPGPELERRLAPFGIRVLRLDMHLPENLAAGVRILAGLLGEDAVVRGEAYLRWTRQTEARLRAAIPEDAARPTVLAEHFAPDRLAGPGSALFALTLKAGGRNLAAELRSASSPVSMEWVVERNPDVVIKSVALSSLDTAKGLAQLEKARGELLALPGWKDLPAARKGRVYAFSSDILGGPRWVVGMAALVAAFYPEAADKADAQALHNEYLHLFQGDVAGGALAAP